MTRIDTDTLRQCRAIAFSTAYRMVGTVTDAEDIAQDAVMRLVAADDVKSPEAFVTTCATRLGIDLLRSARVRRERYVGEWLPEPLISSDTNDDAAQHAELADDISFAFLVLLERLSPNERAALLLHDVLGYSYAETAGILERAEPTTRKLVSRARQHVASERPRYHLSTPHKDRLVERFIAACQHGEVDDFVDLLTEDVVFAGDGGGNVPPGMAISNPVYGRRAVALLLTGFRKRALPASLQPCTVNGGPGVKVTADDSVGGGIIALLALDADQHGIYRINSIVNPDKLHHVGPVTDYARWRE